MLLNEKAGTLKWGLKSERRPQYAEPPLDKKAVRGWRQTARLHLA
jgi:hypothetical protein